MYPNINNLSACACNGVCATSVRVHGQTDVNSSRKHSDRVETKPASLCAHSIINRDVITLSRAYRAYRPGQTIANANHPWLVLFPSCSGEHDPSAGAFQLFSRRGVLFDSMRWTNTRDRSDTGEHGARLVFGKVHVAPAKNSAAAQRAITTPPPPIIYHGLNARHHQRRSQSAPIVPANSSGRHRVPINFRSHNDRRPILSTPLRIYARPIRISAASQHLRAVSSRPVPFRDPSLGKVPPPSGAHRDQHLKFCANLYRRAKSGSKNHYPGLL